MRAGWLRTLQAVALLLAALPIGSGAGDDLLERIERRGRLVVGVKKDVPLWGQADERGGGPVGLEIDLAADLARRIGVRLELVGLLTAERIQAVETGRVDVLIATLSDTPERRRQLALVMPRYYASGANIMARRELGFRQWTDLRNRRVCGRRGAFYNRAITVAFGVDIVALYSNRVALAALRDGRCDALLYDDTHIAALLQEPHWRQGFEMPLPTLHAAPWAVAIHRHEAGGRLQALLSRAVADWHRSGFVLALESKWGIPRSAYSQRMKELWNRRAPGGGYHCGELAQADTPEECL